jgi:hypothetical protein
VGLFSRKSKQGPTGATFTPIDGEQMFVGEKAYQSFLIALLSSRGHSSTSLAGIHQPISESFVARLVPEVGNPYDANAVAVHIDGRTVAYLSRGNAARWRAAYGTSQAESPVVLWVKVRGEGIVSVWPDRGANA